MRRQIRKGSAHRDAAGEDARIGREDDERNFYRGQGAGQVAHDEIGVNCFCYPRRRLQHLRLHPIHVFRRGGPLEHPDGEIGGELPWIGRVRRKHCMQAVVVVAAERVAVPIRRAEGEESAIDQTEPLQAAVAAVLPAVGYDHRTAQGPAGENGILKAQVLDHFAHVGSVLADCVSAEPLAGISVASQVHGDDAELFGQRGHIFPPERG